jgi:hypothetical protein
MTCHIPISLPLVLEFKLYGVKMGNGELLFDILGIVCLDDLIFNIFQIIPLQHV